jgi:hypothetical protein
LVFWKGPVVEKADLPIRGELDRTDVGVQMKGGWADGGHGIGSAVMDNRGWNENIGEKKGLIVVDNGGAFGDVDRVFQRGRL